MQQRVEAGKLGFNYVPFKDLSPETQRYLRWETPDYLVRYLERKYSFEQAVLSAIHKVDWSLVPGVKNQPKPRALRVITHKREQLFLTLGFYPDLLEIGSGYLYFGSVNPEHKTNGCSLFDHLRLEGYQEGTDYLLGDETLPKMQLNSDKWRLETSYEDDGRQPFAVNIQTLLDREEAILPPHPLNTMKDSAIRMRNEALEKGAAILPKEAVRAGLLKLSFRK